MLTRNWLSAQPGVMAAAASAGAVESVSDASPARAAERDDGPAAESALAPMPAAWFHDHVESVWRVVLRLGVPERSVDDVVQEAFIVASRRRADIASGQERSFLIGTAIRLCANYRQKAHIRREVHCGDGFEQELSPLPNAEQLLIERRWRELLDQVLAELSDAHRAPFVLYELEGFSVPEIAELLALPLGTVSSRLCRARAKFSELAALLHGHALAEER